MSAETEVPDLIYDIPRTKVVRLIDDLETARQRQADANTAHMTEWKAAKEAGAPVEALKLCLKLNRMSSDKRNDFLRGFNELRAGIYPHWDQQPDLFQADAANDAEAVALVDDEDETDPQPADIAAASTEGQTRGEGEEKAGTNGDWALDGAAADADQSLDQAGFIFAAGRTAGIEGKTAADNPHDAGSSSAAVWEKGRLSIVPAAAPLSDETLPPSAAVDAEVQNFNAGWAAYGECQRRDANPMAEGSAEAAHWAEGWDAAEKKAWRADAQKVDSGEAGAKRKSKAKAKPAQTEPAQTENVAQPKAAAEGGCATGSNVTRLPIHQTGDVYARMTH